MFFKLVIPRFRGVLKGFNMEYAIRTILAATTIATAFSFAEIEPEKDSRAVELEQQYERMSDSEIMRGDAEIEP